MKKLFKLKLYLQIARNMGFRYMVYRIRHEVEKRSGELSKKHPINPPQKEFISLDSWKNDTPKFFFDNRSSLQLPKIKSNELEVKLNRIRSGEIQFFYKDWIKLGLDYDWVTNPVTGFKFNSNLHWSQIQDFSDSQGDIKYVWEKSRFSFLFDIIRYDYHADEDHSEFVFSQIEDWILKNPINLGPNWKCSQEISLRIFNWMFALNFYKDSPSLTPALWIKISQMIYWSLHHVYHHIDFSKIAVRNNHAITETLFLALSELLFPFIPETKKWSEDGRKWFEEEISYQIYDDGTYLQFSMNYHRVVVQLLTLGISLSEIHGRPFTEVVYDRAYKSIDFLFQCQNVNDGWLPNYGANDGALFFPLASQDFRDYRPQLSSLHKILCQKPLYEHEKFEEEFWLVHDQPAYEKKFQPLKKKFGINRYDDGGFYLIRESDSLTFLRCGSHKDRPQQADNNHFFTVRL